MNLLLMGQQFPTYAITGRTLANLFGKDGNCEDISKFTAYNSAVISLDTTSPKYGTNRLKVAVGTGKTVGYGDRTVGFYAGKYYVALADCINGNATSVTLYGMTVGRYGTVINSTSAYGTSYFKYAPTSDSLTSVLAVQVVGTEGQYGYADGLRLYEISLAEYNKIDIDPDYTGERLAAHFPYVDSVQFKANTLVSAKGKNLIPPFTSSEWTKPANAVVNSDYSLTLNATASGQTVQLFVNVPTNKSIVLSATVSTGFPSQVYRISTAGLYTYIGQISDISPTLSIGSYSDIVQIRITATSAASGTFTFTNPQLELGSTATPFVPQVKTQAHVSTPLGTDDAVYIAGGNAVYKKAWEKNVQL